MIEFTVTKKKKKKELSYDLTISPLDIYLKVSKSGFQRDSTTMFVAVLIHDSQDMETTLNVHQRMDG